MAYFGLYSDPYPTVETSLKSLVFASVMGGVVSVPFYIEAMLHERLQGRMMSVLLFPMAWTSVWFITMTVSPVGSMGHFGYGLVGNETYLQLASLAGLSGLDFILAWWGSVMALVFEHAVGFYSSLSNNVLHVPLYQPTYRKTLRVSVVTFAVVMACLSVYGSGRFALNGRFIQTPIDDVNTTSQLGHCVVGDIQGTENSRMMHATLKAAASGSKLIVWSETASKIKDVEEEEYLGFLGRISATYKTTLVVTYTKVITNTSYERNMAVLLDAQGKIQIYYAKAHPVLGMEGNVIAGDAEMPFYDHPTLGRIGIAICFDVSFPRYMHQLSSNQVDLLVQPSWTWGPIAPWHAHMDSLRAVEQGVHLLRCGSFGLSTLYDPYHNVIHRVVVGGKSVVPMELPAMKKMNTIYSMTGDVLPVFTTLALAYAVFVAVKND
jgi:apolipoprotein N-acyltransferase